MRTDLQKPPRGSHAKVKARNKRVEAKLARMVRSACVERDGYCRLSNLKQGEWVYGSFKKRCDGPSEWAHLEEKRRFKTRGQPAEQRHTTASSVMFCAVHHQEYDAHQFSIRFLSELGADGPIAWERR
jgi:hypothetical protein